MKTITFGLTLVMWSYVLSQDIVFPYEEEIVQDIGTKPPLTEHMSASPLQCPVYMRPYPVNDDKTSEICDCIPGYLYFSVNNTCHEAYRQGPCKPGNYVVLPINESEPKCVENPCAEDGLVPYKNTCSRLKSLKGPCKSDERLKVNATTFQLECESINIGQLTIINPPLRCTKGTKMSFLGRCVKPL